MDLQLPGAITELGASLAQMEMKNLFASTSEFQPCLPLNLICGAEEEAQRAPGAVERSGAERMHPDKVLREKSIWHESL